VRIALIAPSGLVQLDPCHPRDTVEIDVARKDGGSVPPGNSGDHAVDEAPGGDACLPAPLVDPHGAVEVSDRVEPAQLKPQQEAVFWATAPAGWDKPAWWVKSSRSMMSAARVIRPTSGLTRPTVPAMIFRTAGGT
jgi:hypothetical protein